MRVAFFGGSFNPPHVGHAMVAEWLLWTRRADQVLLVPAFAHAFGKDLAPFAARLDWCRALAELLGPRVVATDVEAGLPLPSFTVDTLDHLARLHPDWTLRLVVGADNLLVAAKWKDWARIEAAYAPIVVGRPGYPDVPDAPVFPDVSSTEIRKRLREGSRVDHLVPAAVLERVGTSFRG